ncbi:MAG: transglutaminase domain-containing protein [Clostridia bacterium]
MKKFLVIVVCLAMLLSSMPVMAEHFDTEETFTFDIYDDFYVPNSDEAALMAVDDSVKDKLEEKLIAAWENMDSEVQLYPDIQIHRDDIAAYFAQIYFENPEYYYVARTFSITKNSAGIVGKMTKLSYTTDDKSEIEATWSEIDKATEEILLYINPHMTNFEKVMTVHDYMVMNYVYDLEDMDQTYLILLDRIGVCAAYAEAFQHVMNVLGIECTLVKSEKMGHIWNMVKVGGSWYHVDVTWDDPMPNQFARAGHGYIFLSENAIGTKEHTDFDAPYYADETTYDDAPWHEYNGNIVTIDGVMYYVDGNNVVDENGNIIYKDLDGGDGKWNTSETAYVTGVAWSGLSEINGLLYFNTDTGIYSYDPETKETECILEEYGVGGLYADKNILRYNTYDFDAQVFVEKGEFKVCDVCINGPYFEDEKAVVRLYNDCDTPLWVISKGDTYMAEKVTEKGVNTLTFQNGTNQTIYIWKNNLEPVIEKKIVK